MERARRSWRADDRNLESAGQARILKLERTLADLDDPEGVRAEHVAEAIQYRVLDRTLWLCD